MIKAVIFDFDDTLVDSDPLHIEAWEQTLRKHTNKDTSDFRSLRSKTMMGRSSLRNAQTIVEHYELTTTPEDFYHQKTQLFLELTTRLKLLPGVLHSVKLFKQLELSQAIATGSPREYIEMVLKRFKIFGYFDVIVTAEDIHQSKPAPETYLVACSKLKLKPIECVAIEDATAGVQSAKTAGCKCIAIPNKNVSNQNYSEADLVLSSLEKISKKDIQKLEAP